MLKTLAVDQGLLPASGAGLGLGLGLLDAAALLGRLAGRRRCGCCPWSSKFGRNASRGLLPPAVGPPSLAELGAVDEGLRQRMLAMFPPPPPPPPTDGEPEAGASNEQEQGRQRLPSLHGVIVELDGRFITEVTHTAAMFAELFPPGGRKRLVKVGRCWGGSWVRASGGL